MTMYYWMAPFNKAQCFPKQVLPNTSLPDAPLKEVSRSQETERQSTLYMLSSYVFRVTWTALTKGSEKFCNNKNFPFRKTGLINFLGYGTPQLKITLGKQEHGQGHTTRSPYFQLESQSAQLHHLRPFSPGLSVSVILPLGLLLFQEIPCLFSKKPCSFLT